MKAVAPVITGTTCRGGGILKKGILWSIAEGGA